MHRTIERVIESPEALFARLEGKRWLDLSATDLVKAVGVSRATFFRDLAPMPVYGLAYHIYRGATAELPQITRTAIEKGGASIDILVGIVKSCVEASASHPELGRTAVLYIDHLIGTRDDSDYRRQVAFPEIHEALTAAVEYGQYGIGDMPPGNPFDKVRTLSRIMLFGCVANAYDRENMEGYLELAPSVADLAYKSK